MYKTKRSFATLLCATLFVSTGSLLAAPAASKAAAPAAAPAAAAAATAAPDTGMQGDIGLYTGYIGFGQNSGLGNASYRYDVPAGAVAIGLRGGLMLNQNLGFEAAGRYSSTSFRSPDEFNDARAEPNIPAYETGEGSEASVIGLRVLARYAFPLSSDTITPFVTLGGGMDMISSEKKYTQDGVSYNAIKTGDTDWAFEVGAGANIKLTHDLRLRIDASYFAGEPAAEREFIKGGGGIVSNFQILAGIAYVLGGPAGDSDGDGLTDDKDKCPDEAEDKDGFEDTDGCPETDNDKDGVLDKDDKCPNEAEDKDGFKDYDGCPELDNDLDGVPDGKDKCPNKKEDLDKYQDDDGCPDEDNDKDGIPDSKDKCPNQAEDPDGFQDEDGCPDDDDDNDGVPDKSDKCPKEPETRNNYQDDDGCPDDMPQAVVDLTSKPVYGVSFKRKTGEVDARKSKRALAPLVATMTANAAFNFELQCHVDVKPPRRLKKGASPADPQAISDARCAAIKTYLESQGIAQRRLRTKGFGNSKQLDTSGGRKSYGKNTRLELALW